MLGGLWCKGGERWCLALRSAASEWQMTDSKMPVGDRHLMV
ncbi:MAG: hypothetical protein RIQ83_2270 [Pseudomonadota bacterium]|jgi:hypothetical protein